MTTLTPDAIRRIGLESSCHYHVSCVGPSTAIPTIVVDKREKVANQFELMVQLVLDTTDLKLTRKSEVTALFSDGTIVMWRACFKSCLDD